MKRLVGIFLSIAMINLQVGTAFAGSMGGTSTITKDDPRTGNEVTVGNETTKKATEADASAAITVSAMSLFASAVLGPVYALHCSTMPSAWIFAGTAGIYVGGEVMNWNRYKSASDRVMKAYLGNKDSTNQQIDSLNSAKQQTLEAADAASRKTLFARIASAGYGAASAMALVETYTSWFNGGACPTPGAQAKPEDQIFKFDDSVHKSMIASIEGGNNEDSYFVFQDYTRFLNGENSSITLDEYYQAVGHVEEIVPGNFKSAILAAAIGVKNTIMSDAIAGGFGEEQLTKAGIGVGFAASALTMLFKSQLVTMLGPELTAITTSGVFRASLFGASSGIALFAGEQISKATKKLESRAANYEELVKKLETLSTNQTGITDDTKTVSTETIAIVDSTENKVKDLSNQDPCFVQTTNGKTVTDSMCSCKASNTCKKPKIPKVTIKDFNMPKVMTSSLKSLDATGKSLFSGNYAKAKTSGEALVSNAASISKFRKDMEDKINKKLNDEGKDSLNFRSAEKKWKDKLEKTSAKALKSMKPTDAKRLLAMINGTSGQGDSQNKVAENVAKKSGINIKTKGGSGSAGGQSGTVADSNQTADPFGGLNFEMDDAEKAKLAAAGAAASADEAGYEYDKDRKQISENSGKSIFKLISTRYLKSAFPRLFTEQKEQ